MRSRSWLWLGLALWLLAAGSAEAQYYHFPPRYHPPAVHPRSVVIVGIRHNQFTPGRVTIRRGQTVTWLNFDFQPHTVTAGRSGLYGPGYGFFDTPPFYRGGAASFTFYRPGVYPYFCRVHPWMRGTVVVR